MNRGVVWLVAGAVTFGASSAEAQYFSRGPGVIVASDFDPPYENGGPTLGPPLPPRYAPYPSAPRYAPPPYAGDSYGPSAYAAPMLSPGEIIRIARQNGFSPLGEPQPRGFVYRIAVISPDGDDGRLVIDARTGRILRFLPAYDYGSRFYREPAYASAPVGSLPPISGSRASLRPPTATPRIAAPSPLPAPAQRRQADLQQTIPPAPPAASAVAPAPPPTATPPIAAPPANNMPPAQGLD